MNVYQLKTISNKPTTRNVSIEAPKETINVVDRIYDRNHSPSREVSITNCSVSTSDIILSTDSIRTTCVYRRQ